MRIESSLARESKPRRPHKAGHQGHCQRQRRSWMKQRLFNLMGVFGAYLTVITIKLTQHTDLWQPKSSPRGFMSFCWRLWKQAAPAATSVIWHWQSARASSILPGISPARLYGDYTTLSRALILWRQKVYCNWLLCPLSTQNHNWSSIRGNIVTEHSSVHLLVDISWHSWWVYFL